MKEDLSSAWTCGDSRVLTRHASSRFGVMLFKAYEDSEDDPPQFL